MHTRLLALLTAGLLVSMGFGCSAPILRQAIPVSTNPVGAKVYADGQYLGQTPTSVSLERNSDHVLTFIKENFQQEDVSITRVYQREQTLLRAVSAGVNAQQFFKDSRMGLSTGVSSMSAQEETGEAYILTPGSVALSLTRMGEMRISGGSVPAGSVGYAGSSGESSAADQRELARGLTRAALDVAASETDPVGKKWSSSSSSSRTYTSTDGTRSVTKTSKTTTSVGVGFNPVGLLGALDTLFK